MPTANTSSRSRAKDKKKIRIVIADDHAIFRDGLKKLLSLERDLDVIGEAEDGQQTVELVKKLQPDILLLDLKMPVKRSGGVGTNPRPGENHSGHQC